MLSKIKQNKNITHLNLDTEFFFSDVCMRVPCSFIKCKEISV